MSKNNKFESKGQTVRNFDYSKGETSLKFSLRVDTKDQLSCFIELLNAAIIDVTQELNK